MPLKKDEKGQRWVEMELVLPATPEQLWQAIATGPGTTAWFTRAEIDGRVGGALRFHFGPDASTSGEVTAWEPASRFAYVEREWDPGAPPVATEITITARAGGNCVMRMVHSLFTSSDAWDDQVEGFEAGWPGFFAVLRLYLRHFAGEPAASFIVGTSSTATAGAAFAKLCRELGVAVPSVGERATGTEGPERWSAEVEHVYQDHTQRYVLLRLDAPNPGIALFGTHQKGGSTRVSVCRYFYGTEAEAQAAEAEPTWRAWLTQTFGG